MDSDHPSAEMNRTRNPADIDKFAHSSRRNPGARDADYMGHDSSPTSPIHPPDRAVFSPIAPSPYQPADMASVTQSNVPSGLSRWAIHGADTHGNTADERQRV